MATYSGVPHGLPDDNTSQQAGYGESLQSTSFLQSYFLVVWHLFNPAVLVVDKVEMRLDVQMRFHGGGHGSSEGSLSVKETQPDLRSARLEDSSHLIMFALVDSVLPAMAAFRTGPPGSASSGRSPLREHLDFFKNITTDKKQTKDGQPPKRRGPKPDSKPALTRRQELNRQAQRTHRERKEQYIKALEQEVLHLKEIYAQSTRERDQVVEENRRLKELLAQHGISYEFGQSPIKFNRENSGPSSYGSSGSISGSYRGTSESTGFTPPSSAAAPAQSVVQANGMRNMAQLPNNRLDFDQIGIDFVLTYDPQGQPMLPYPSPPPQL